MPLPPERPAARIFAAGSLILARDFTAPHRLAASIYHACARSGLLTCVDRALPGGGPSIGQDPARAPIPASPVHDISSCLQPSSHLSCLAVRAPTGGPKAGHHAVLASHSRDEASSLAGDIRSQAAWCQLFLQPEEVGSLRSVP